MSSQKKTNREEALEDEVIQLYRTIDNLETQLNAATNYENGDFVPKHEYISMLAEYQELQQEHHASKESLSKLQKECIQNQTSIELLQRELHTQQQQQKQRANPVMQITSLEVEKEDQNKKLEGQFQEYYILEQENQM